MFKYDDKEYNKTMKQIAAELVEAWLGPRVTLVLTLRDGRVESHELGRAEALIALGLQPKRSERGY